MQCIGNPMIDPQLLCMRTAALTHVGRRREKNEDCIAIGARTISEPMATPWVAAHRLDQPCVCLIADGMGGHPAGDVASRTALEHLSAMLSEGRLSEHGIVAALRSANRALFTEMARAPDFYGMGTTLAGIAAHETGVFTFNVGDSRVYRVHAGAVEQISVDDSAKIPSAGFLYRGPARVLLQCLGGYAGSDEIVPHLSHLPAKEGVGLLICSDGLSDMLSDQDIAACLDEDLSNSVSALFECAMSEGGIDNISIIYARIERAESAADAA